MPFGNFFIVLAFIRQMVQGGAQEKPKQVSLLSPWIVVIYPSSILRIFSQTEQSESSLTDQSESSLKQTNQEKQQ